MYPASVYEPKVQIYIKIVQYDKSRMIFFI
jgi:hypothetical protein